MEISLFNGRDVIEKRIRLYKVLSDQSSYVRIRYQIDPLSQFVLDAMPDYLKLEVYVLATTLLRYSDALKLDVTGWLQNKTQDIIQSKTKSLIELPPLFSNSYASQLVVDKSILLFSDSYNKLLYSFNHSLPNWLISAIPKSRKKLHIFRFLRAVYYHVENRDRHTIVKLLGHKNYESIESYLPVSLINSYQSFIRKVS